MIHKVFFEFFFRKKNEFLFCFRHFYCLCQQGCIQLDGSDTPGIFAMLIGLAPSICGQLDIGMLHNIVLVILNRPLTSDKEQGKTIVQHTHLVRGQQFPACQLPIDGVASAAAT